MNKTLSETLNGLPESPGVYKMLDAGGNIIYIGKSKCLKKRVHSYFVPEPKWEKAKKMRPFIVNVEYEVTDTHLEAQLLECCLIKSVKPYFNVMMKNDERYFFLAVGEDARKSPLLISRERTGDSFGPLRRKGAVEELIKSFRNLYPLTKSRGRVCFDYHVLPEKQDWDAFWETREVLVELFSDSQALGKFLKALDKKMQESARAQQFERAVRYRDLIGNLSYLWRCLHKFEIFRGRELLYQVPLKEGCKVFYIQKGRIAASEKLKNNAREELLAFLESARAQGETAVTGLSEKGSVDYEDILFAELTQAPEDALTLL